MPATKESEAEFEARMQSDLNRILAEQKALHLQACGLPPPAWAVEMRTQAFLEQAEIHRRARKGWVGALSCIPWPIPRSNRSQTPYMGSKWLRFFRVIRVVRGFVFIQKRKAPILQLKAISRLGQYPDRQWICPLPLPLHPCLSVPTACPRPTSARP